MAPRSKNVKNFQRPNLDSKKKLANIFFRPNFFFFPKKIFFFSRVQPKNLGLVAKVRYGHNVAEWPNSIPPPPPPQKKITRNGPVLRAKSPKTQQMTFFTKNVIFGGFRTFARSTGPFRMIFGGSSWATQPVPISHFCYKSSRALITVFFRDAA